MEKHREHEKEHVDDLFTLRGLSDSPNRVFNGHKAPFAMVERA
jgi:hypothetical protein